MFFSARKSREFDEELATHLHSKSTAMPARHDSGRRASPCEARFGGIQQTKEHYRDQIGLPALDSALPGIRGGIRIMRRTPAFTAIAILTLAIGIGANTVMFSVVNTVLLHRCLTRTPISWLAHVESVDSRGQTGGTAPPDFYRYRRSNQTFDLLDRLTTKGRSISRVNRHPNASTR